jgi:hypothetical protein
MQLTLPAAPSKRDRDIYYAVRSHGMKQVDVAKEFHVSQPRISQILKKVTEWTAKFAPLQGFGGRRRDLCRAGCLCPQVGMV